MLTINEIKYYIEMRNKSKAILDDLGINYSKNIEWSSFNRSRTWGQCTNNHDGSYKIKITEKLIKTFNDHSVCDTIIHELLHTCKNCNCHTGEWLRLAKLVNSKTEFNIKRVNSAEEKGIKRDYKYKVICEGCHATSYYYSNNKFIKRKGSGYRCVCGCRSFITYDKDDKFLWESHTIEDLINRKIKFSTI